MALLLLEYVTEATGREAIQPLFDQIAAATSQAGGEVIEVQVAADLQRAYAVVEHDDQAVLTAALSAAGVAPNDVAPVRLVGATIEQVKESRGVAEYLVEWDLPAELTMETYLARKQAKTPLYANVPEVSFLRTYVREDMVKCLCLYDAPDEDAVRRARAAVTTPIDRLARLGGVNAAG
jgi:hypothetical protein